MQSRWAPAFTIVELIIVIVVIAILAAITLVTYSGFTERAQQSAAYSDLRNTAVAMEDAIQHTNTYPDTLPSSVKASGNMVLTLVRGGSLPFYESLSTVQNGVLISDVCDLLIAKGVGKGTNQGGGARDYITGCGNWNDDSMQVTGWTSKVWSTPVQKQTLLDYADNFTASTSWDADQERVVKAFYTQLVALYEQQGGTFPVTSFWDYWATGSNGGVIKQPLDTDAAIRPYFCAEVYAKGRPERIWHITQDEQIKAGSC